MYSVGCKTVFGGKVSKLTKLKSVQNQSQFEFDDIPFLCLSGRSNRYDILTPQQQRAEGEKSPEALNTEFAMSLLRPRE
jgi:hypothetical protein